MFRNASAGSLNVVSDGVGRLRVEDVRDELGDVAGRVPLDAGGGRVGRVRRVERIDLGPGLGGRQAGVGGLVGGQGGRVRLLDRRHVPEQDGRVLVGRDRAQVGGDELGRVDPAAGQLRVGLVGEVDAEGSDRGVAVGGDRRGQGEDAEAVAALGDGGVDLGVGRLAGVPDRAQGPLGDGVGGDGRVAAVVDADGPGAVDAGGGGERRPLAEVGVAGDGGELDAVGEPAGRLDPLGVGQVEPGQAGAGVGGDQDGVGRDRGAGEVVEAGRVPRAGGVGRAAGVGRRDGAGVDVGRRHVGDRARLVGLAGRRRRRCRAGCWPRPGWPGCRSPYPAVPGAANGRRLARPGVVDRLVVRERELDAVGPAEQVVPGRVVVGRAVGVVGAEAAVAADGEPAAARDQVVRAGAGPGAVEVVGAVDVDRVGDGRAAVGPLLGGDRPGRLGVPDLVVDQVVGPVDGPVPVPLEPQGRVGLLDGGRGGARVRAGETPTSPAVKSWLARFR